ncbi:DNA-binding GntR family transcriptional regulator [Bradyrhizobium sp. USDA 3686]|nr:DNA-binding GntR family transcriptional regulator [Bradyrhizobium canariense]
MAKVTVHQFTNCDIGIRRSRDEHEAIMQVIAEGDGDTAARRMRAHMLNAAAALRRYIDDALVNSAAAMRLRTFDK